MVETPRSPRATEPADTGPWPRGISAITLCVENLSDAKRFYHEVFGLPVAFEDDVSAVFKFENTLINLLKYSEAPELVGPARVASPEAGARMQFTVDVDDVDAMCAELASRGVELLNGPVDRPWGNPNGQFPRSWRPHLGNRGRRQLAKRGTCPVLDPGSGQDGKMSSGRSQGWACPVAG
ncbi:hypothetical protein BJG92_02474 [Arthrobacter sp. SO5]|uniref:VOC family protein n=1 Tax=Arthrobacter sp. SO5 TaxID=1897055 RepID=UPI0035ABCBFD|nr:hypothetical protein [Arthrobacter sp. SO5]